MKKNHHRNTEIAGDRAIINRLILLFSLLRASVSPCLICLQLAGCSYVNVPLNSDSIPQENRIQNHTRAETVVQNQPADLHSPKLPPTSVPVTDNDGYFVGLALSGGGSRSANFSAAAMFELQRVGILNKVDYISSVSGGSLTAAYYCLNKEKWTPVDLQRAMTHEFATDMLVQTLLPWNTFALIFTDLDRSDLLAKTLRENLFTVDGKQQTFADLRPDRPRLLINATDLQSGKRFVFCNQSFDGINSDLSKYPIAYAVAASASVPVVLHQVTLRDFSTDFKQYRHLIDGGVCDNLGVETLVETFRAHEDAATAAHLPDPYPHGAIFISIDARVDYDQDISSKSDTSFFETLAVAAGISSAALMNRASQTTLDDVVFQNAPDTATAKQIRSAIADLGKDGYVDFQNVGGHRIRCAHIALTQLQGINEVPFHSFQEYVNSTSTYFNIDSSRAALLYKAAEILIRGRFEAHFKDILSEMAADSAQTKND